MFGSSGHRKPREQSRRMHYRVESLAEDDDEDDDGDGGDDSDSPYFEPTDLSDNEMCDCTRSPAVNTEATRQDRARRKASRRPSQVPCAVEADSLPLARPIPLHYDSDLYDTWCTRSRKLNRHSGGEQYRENRASSDVALVHEAKYAADCNIWAQGGRSIYPGRNLSMKIPHRLYQTADRGDGVGSKFKASPSTAPPPPETVVRLINQSLSRLSAAGVGVAAPTATTPRFYRRSTREASRRPSRLCLPVASQLDPSAATRRQGVQGTRSQQVTSAGPALIKLPGDGRAALRHGAVGKASAQAGEVKIPVQAHVSYVPQADNTPRSGTAARAHRRRPCGEIRIPLDVFASPFLACTSDVEHWTHQLKKSSSHRVRRNHTKEKPMRSHVIAQPVIVERTEDKPLRKLHSIGGGVKVRAASEKPPQKHRAPSVRSRASDTVMPHAVQSNLDALLPSYEAQMAQPSVQRRSSCAAQVPAQSSSIWGNRPDPRLIPRHLLKPRKPESVRQREFIALLEGQLRAAAQPRPAQAQQEATSPPSTNVAQPSAQPPAQSPALSPPTPQTEQAASSAHAVPSAESKLSSLLEDLMKNGFDVSHLERKTTGAAVPTPNVKGAVTPPRSTQTSKLDPRGFYEAVYNQQSLARVDFTKNINAGKESTPAELTASLDKSTGCCRKVDADASAAKEYHDWRSGDEQRRPRSRTTSECANYASQDEESVFENQDFWDTLDHNVDLNSVQSLSDGFEGHEDSYKYFRNGKIPSMIQHSTSQTALQQNLGDSTSDQRRGNHGSLHELWRHSDHRKTRAQSEKPEVDLKNQPRFASGCYQWPSYKKKSGNGGQIDEGSRPETHDCHGDLRGLSTAAEPSSPATSYMLDADDARRLRVTRSLIVAVVEETLKRREKACQPVGNQNKMNIGQAIELIKQKSSTMNDALCMEIAKALSDRLIDCETAKSEKEYVTQLKKLRSDHLRHISREVKRLQDLEGLVQSACSKLGNGDCH